ncbi:hypothetical protein ANN_17259 [Periplaneta americana]|uniref:Uncharacterized protein n=1 Tax=Periplaneta americana TaxID=6978 RepID=A0ABQ8SSG0_PERAM|nr:hypothetical protein ANN_17259 [Periplaneta americana]
MKFGALSPKFLQETSKRTFKNIFQWIKVTLLYGLLRCRVGPPPHLDPVDMWSFVVSGSAMHRGLSTGLTVTHGTRVAEPSKRLRFHPYRLQLLQALKPEDKVLRRNFCIKMQTLIENGDEFIRCMAFSGEATFYLSSKNRPTLLRLERVLRPNYIEDEDEIEGGYGDEDVDGVGLDEDDEDGDRDEDNAGLKIFKANYEYLTTAFEPSGRY